MKQTAAVLGTTKQTTNVTQTETVTRAGTTLVPLLVPLSREPGREQPLRPACAPRLSLPTRGNSFKITVTRQSGVTVPKTFSCLSWCCGLRA